MFWGKAVCLPFVISGLIVTSSTTVMAAEQGASAFYVRADMSANRIKDTKGTIGDTVNPPDTVAFQSETAPGFGIGVGYVYNDFLRFDATLSRVFVRKLSGQYTDDGTPKAFSGMAGLSSNVAMLNGYVELSSTLGLQESPWRPYLSGGLGLSQNRLREFNTTAGSGQIDGDTNVSAAWSLGLGSGYKINKAVTIDAWYKYADLGTAHSTRSATYGTVRLNSPLEFDVKSHAVGVGVRYGF